jgi:hypothetical protein
MNATTIITHRPHSRTPVAERLLAAPDLPAGDWRELDWDGAPVDGAPWTSWTCVSLWGTPTWGRLDHPQRLELSRHETASITALGIWAENVLMQMLLRVAAEEPARSACTRYTLTEVGDECRHSLMFSRLLGVLDTPDYGPRPAARRLTGAFAGLAHPVEAFATALIVEEILDGLQRPAVHDPEVQPLAREVSRVHVVEEARHISFARDELARRWAVLSPARRAAYAMTVAAGAGVIASSLIDRQVYAAVGLDPRRTAREVRRSAHRQALLRSTTARLVDDLTELGLITSAARPLWRAAGLA